MRTELLPCAGDTMIDVLSTTYIAGEIFAAKFSSESEGNKRPSKNHDSGCGYAYVGGNPVNFIDPFGLCRDRTGGQVAEIEFPLSEKEKKRQEFTDQLVLNLKAAVGLADNSKPGDPIVLTGTPDLPINKKAAIKFLSKIKIGKFFKDIFAGKNPFAKKSAENLVKNIGTGGKSLPRSGPIIQSAGAMSRADRLARKFGLNINSAPTRQVLNSLDDSVESFITQFRKPGIRGKLPGEFLNKTVDEALSSGNTTVRKLLTDNRFIK